MVSEDSKSETLRHVQQKEDENTELFEQLTNKNKEYMIKLNRILEEYLTDAERTEEFNRMLREIIDAQSEGVTARAKFGTVTERAQEIIGYNEEPDETTPEKNRSEDWKLYLDSALMLGGLFAVVQGISGFFDAESAQGGAMGIVSLVLNFLIGGFVGLLMTKNAPNKEEKGKESKDARGRYLMVSTMAMLVWVVIMMAVILVVPPTINFLLPAELIFGVGVVAILLKFVLKKVLNIRGTLM